MVEYLLYALMGYCIGGIPFGLLLTKAAGYGDIRGIGSGNIGATNVLRTGNKKLALATLLLDGGKGAVVVAIAHVLLKSTLTDCGLLDFASPPEHMPKCWTHWQIMPEELLAGFFAVVGHMYPACLKFKGGKGVATTLGVLLAWSPPVGAACCLIWLAMAFAFRYSSLAALVAILCAPPAAWFITQQDMLAGTSSIIALLVWMKHRANIRRLVSGEEPKIGKKKPAPDAGAA